MPAPSPQTTGPRIQSLGGGRLLGEACHFVDLLRHLAASPIEDLQLINAADRKPCPDTFSLQLRFARWLDRHRALFL
jgi:predicted dehydrogenase